MINQVSMKYLAFWAISFFFACQEQVLIVDNEMCEGQECYRITTPTATYLYQKEAGGFSNIYDADGTDWIQFHKTGKEGYPHSAASDYRGLPNLVFRSDDGGCGHPGFDKMTSKLISQNQIRSISKSGNWQWTWTFYSKYAELSVEKTDPDQAYWFLYEGPIAGKFSPTTHYWGTNVSGPSTEQPDHILKTDLRAVWHTAYFGDTGYDKAFFVKQMENDTLQDLYSYMGNTKQGNDSPDGMVVFGFGRAEGATPLMTAQQKFIVGFYDQKITTSKDHMGIISWIQKLTN